MQHLGDFHKIRESRLLAADPHHLWRSHHELLLLSRDHLGVFIPHDGEDSLQKLIILVVTIRIFPGVFIIQIFHTSPVIIIVILLILAIYVISDMWILPSWVGCGLASTELFAPLTRATLGPDTKFSS